MRTDMRILTAFVRRHDLSMTLVVEVQKWYRKRWFIVGKNNQVQSRFLSKITSQSPTQIDTVSKFQIWQYGFWRVDSVVGLMFKQSFTAFVFPYTAPNKQLNRNGTILRSLLFLAQSTNCMVLLWSMEIHQWRYYLDRPINRKGGEKFLNEFAAGVLLTPHDIIAQDCKRRWWGQDSSHLRSAFAYLRSSRNRLDHSSTAGKNSLSHRLESHSSFKQSRWRFALRFILITGNNGAHHQIRWRALSIIASVWLSTRVSILSQ